ncbi:sulfotransferase family 2 domain-containing protein [Pseudooceanicola sp. 200-1SW]|uniref:sulfotransferase family 2 domain-containing protein n=1 Tax=Pseudooceanicola sp. 200-1SW TaxID=3425949 RepID=UPI003D7F74DB
MISHDHKLIFVHIPKCAGTSVEAFFGHHADYDGRFKQDHRTMREIEPLYRGLTALSDRENRKLILRRLARAVRSQRNPRNKYRVNARQFREYYKFTILRDPWSRVYSGYRNVIRDAHHTRRRGPIRDFQDFVEKFAGRTRLAPADYWLANFDGKVRMDRIVYFSDLSGGLAKVAQDLGLDKIELPKMLHTGDNTDLREVYDDRSRAIIQDRYAKEIEDHGFSFDLV